MTGTGLSNSDRVVFQFETAAALSTGAYFFTPLSWQFSAGAASFGSADAGASLFLTVAGPIYLSMDSNGLDAICTSGKLSGA